MRGEECLCLFSKKLERVFYMWHLCGITVETFSFQILKALVILSGDGWLVCFHETAGCDLDSLIF